MHPLDLLALTGISAVEGREHADVLALESCLYCIARSQTSHALYASMCGIVLHGEA